MKPDKEIKKEFRPKFWSDPDKYYATDVLREEGFGRKICTKCRKPFWSTDPERRTCGDPACSGEGFSFIGDSPATNRLDYPDVWLRFAKMFKGLGYTPINRYPVVARWNPTMEYTNASIAAFQPFVISGEVEPPANPLVIPQFCLRFSDIDNVGITQSHNTGFVMIGQHMFVKPEKWDQNRVFRDIHSWLNKGLGLKNSDIIFHEDAWAGGGNFGPCMEYFSRGCELGNQVYMLYEQTVSGNKGLGIKVLDMGMGQERNAWFSQGSETIYDATFPTVIEKLLPKTGLKIDKNLMRRYVPHAGLLNLDETDNIEKAWERVSKNVGVDVKHLRDFILPLSGVYSIAEHMRSLLFALADGGLPSNVGGGYNLRILARRAMSFKSEYGWDVEFAKVCEWHAKYLKPVFPELLENIDNVARILEVEESKYENTRKKSAAIVGKISKGGLSEKDLLMLYDSHGIPPEIVKMEFEKAGKVLKIPEDFYMKVSDLHEKRSQEAEIERDEKIELKGAGDTKILYYGDYMLVEFDAKVIRTAGDFVVLDQSGFYPTSGGQLHDKGTIDGKEVIDVFKQGGAIVHRVEKNHGLKEGRTVRCHIDPDRRRKLSQQHTATHLVNAAARMVLGNHVNQAGAKKTEEKSHLDITHYLPITADEMKKIEELSNKMVTDGIDVEKLLLPRNDAEKKFGMRIYQGGAVPGKILRIVNINGVDVEACGGTHVNNTREIGRVKILKTTKIQDGIDRIEFTTGENAGKAADMEAGICREMLDSMKKVVVFNGKKRLAVGLAGCASILSVPPDQTGKTVKKFTDDIMMFSSKLHKPVRKERASSLEEACRIVFSLWKNLKKEVDSASKERAGTAAEKLVKMAKDGEIFEIVEMERNDMINLCNSIVSEYPDLTVILVNGSGDVIGMSEKKDIAKAVRHLCEKYGGSGGGKGRLAQGKLNFEKLKNTEKN
jgi:alanyl-tRNA synthetase